MPKSNSPMVLYNVDYFWGYTHFRVQIESDDRDTLFKYVSRVLGGSDVTIQEAKLGKGKKKADPEPERTEPTSTPSTPTDFETDSPLCWCGHPLGWHDGTESPICKGKHANGGNCECVEYTVMPEK